MPKTAVYLQRSNKSGKKYMVTILQKNGRRKTVHFGATGYSDYTKHKDKERKARYDARHRARENWGKSGIGTAGFWSKWLLWSSPSLGGAISSTSRKFGLTIKRGAPPRAKSPKRSVKRSPRRRSKQRSRSVKSKSRSRRRSKRRSRR